MGHLLDDVHGSVAIGCENYWDISCTHAIIRVMTGALIIGTLLLLFIFLAMKLKNVLLVLFLGAFLAFAGGTILYSTTQQPLAVLLAVLLLAAAIVPTYIVQSRREKERRRQVDDDGHRIWLAANSKSHLRG
jgi:membrane protein implicated in regulation of membrane protease activity